MANQKLTLKQEAFALEYIIDLNATQAAIRAGYSKKTAKVIGCENLTKPNIQAYIQKEMEDRGKRTKITADRVLEEFGRIAFFDIRKLYNERGQLIPIAELDTDTALALSSFKTRREKQGQSDYDIIEEYKMNDKQRALDSIGRHLGMFIDKSEVKTQLEVNYYAPEKDKEN